MTSTAPHRADSFASAVQMLADAIGKLKATAESSAGRDILRLEVPLVAGTLSPLPWLETQASDVVTYWSDRRGDLEMAGVGAARIVRSETRVGISNVLSSMAQLLPEAGELRLYGGMRFDSALPAAADAGVGDEWRPFGSCLFVMPRFEVVARGPELVLACNLPSALVESDKEKLQSDLSRLRPMAGQQRHPSCRLSGRADLPSPADWDTMVAEVVKAIGGGDAEKVVLARRTTLEVSGRLNALALLSRLKHHSEGCFHFCIRPPSSVGGSAAFVGAPPERLYCRNGRTIHTEAVAGTRPRGESRESDAIFENELLNSEKDCLEQAHVARFIADALGRLCGAVRADAELSVLKAAGVQHLVTRFEGQLRPGVDDAGILSALHPTPAVGGVPTDRATGLISELEPFDRGWYAGAVGWVAADAAEFAVAIRSALVGEDRLRLYAGAGIVSGSTAPEEWCEVENKMSGYLKVVSES